MKTLEAILLMFALFLMGCFGAIMALVIDPALRG